MVLAHGSHGHAKAHRSGCGRSVEMKLVRVFTYDSLLAPPAWSGSAGPARSMQTVRCILLDSRRLTLLLGPRPCCVVVKLAARQH